MIYQNPPIEDSYPVNFRLQRTASPSEKNKAWNLENGVLDSQEDKRVRFFEDGSKNVESHLIQKFTFERVTPALSHAHGLANQEKHTNGQTPVEVAKIYSHIYPNKQLIQASQQFVVPDLDSKN